MEKSFDFGVLLKNNEKKHKNKPEQFVSVAGGVKKRLQKNLQNSKNTRLTIFDCVRDLPVCGSPVPPSAKEKIEHRRQQLEKWKLEKEQKKKEAMAQKKKPFVTGVARAPLKFVPPPPPPPKPSSAGAVTRSQAKKNLGRPKVKISPPKTIPKGKTVQSFAPKNASFNPDIRTTGKMPVLLPPSKNKTKISVNMITFDPIDPTANNTQKQTRTRNTLTRQNAFEVKTGGKSIPQVETRSTRSQAKKQSPKKQLPAKISSKRDIGHKSIINRVKTPKKPLPEAKKIIPKVLSLKSSSEEQSSEDSSAEKPVRKSIRKSVTSSSQDSTDSERQAVTINIIKSSQVASSITSGSSSDVLSETDISIKSPVVRLTRQQFIDSRSESDSEKLSSSSANTITKKALSSSLDTDSGSDQLSSDNIQSPTFKLNRKSLPKTPVLGVPKSESKSEEKLRSPKSPITLPLTPEQMEQAKISPTVTMSRGKDNARKETKWKLDEGLLDEDCSNIDSVEHFRKQLSSEIARMTEMCDAWDKLLQQTVLPDTVQEAILSAVGQARLLMTQKLQQFAQLVERCARPEPGAALVTPADLQGFWDMVFLQVENVDVRFKKLEELRARGWVEEPAVVAPPPLAVRGRRAPRARPPAAGSRIRDMIAAARKANKQSDRAPTAPAGTAPASPAPPAPPAPAHKTFDAGFFCVRSPVRSPPPAPAPAPATPINKTTLLKAVLSSEAKKSVSKCCTPFAMLRASMLAKHDTEGISPLPRTPHMTPNSLATPGRSILKYTNTNPRSSGKKSIKTVLFHSTDTEPSSEIDPNSADAYQTAIEVDLNDTQNKENSPILTRNNAQGKVNSLIQSRKSQVKENSPIPTKNSAQGKENSPIQTRNAAQGKENSPIQTKNNAQGKENSPIQTRNRRRSSAIEATPDVNEKVVRTRRQRKNLNGEESTVSTPMVTPRRSARKKTTQVEEEVNRSTGRKRNVCV